MTATTSPLRKKKLTPEQRKFNRLQKRIKEQFDRKSFLGDIIVSDDEYFLLLADTKKVLISMERNQKAFKNRPMLAVTLVQIGVRNYNGNYWPHVDTAFHVKLNQRQRQMLSDTFMSTLRLHKKYTAPSGGGSVQTILLHGFVSNYYSKGLFEMLFQYYTKDLERNIYRNTTEQMQALMDTLIEKAEEDESSSNAFMDQFMDSSSRAYRLRKHTLQAISAFPSHSRARLRRLLRLIDRAFWKNSVPKNPVSRLTILFKEWVNDSKAYREEYRLYQLGEIRNRGKKHFSMPYLFADIADCRFLLKLPSQLVPEKAARDLDWEITTNSRNFRLSPDSYPALTGYKTEDMKCSITSKELFGKIRCKLISGDIQIRRFADIPANEVRFFDMEGDYAPRLFKIPMCAYTCSSGGFDSPALLDKLCYGEITRWDFEFQAGDPLILPDGSGMIVGENYIDGFTPRGKVRDAFYTGPDGDRVPVYSILPELLLTIPEHSLKGTVLYVDDRRYALRDCRSKEFEQKDSKGVCAVSVPFAQFGRCVLDGLHTAILDIPGANFDRKYSFLYVAGFNVSFDGAPYIFEERGTVIFPDHIHVTSDCEKIYGENGFQFELNANEPVLKIMVQRSIPLDITIPMLSWSLDQENWHLAPIGEIWHTEFFEMQKIYLRSPCRKVSVLTDTDIPDDDDAEERMVNADSSGDFLVLDMTRFKSWLTRDTMRNEITLRADKHDYPFAIVYTRSIAGPLNVTADYDTDSLICHINILGKSEYFIDIVHLDSGTVLADKVPIQNEGKFVLHSRLLSGHYKFTLYEADEDDSGFDDIIYNPIHTEQKELINKNNFSNKVLEICRIQPLDRPRFHVSFSHEYIVPELQKIGRSTYYGQLLIDRKESAFQLEIIFPDLEDPSFFNLTFWHDEEECNVPFLYDCGTKQLVKDELPGLRPSEKYRRYREIDEPEYVYCGAILDVLPEKEPPVVPENSSPRQQHPAVSLENMKFSVRTYNALKRRGVKNSHDIEYLSIRELRAARDFSNDCLGELLRKAAEYDLNLSE